LTELPANDWVAVARLLRTRGNKGELLAESLTSHPERLEELKRVTLAKTGKRAEVDVARVWFHDGRPVFQFEGVASISDAEVWSGAEVLIPAVARKPLPEGEYYFSDLIGCRVRHWETGEEIGAVVDVEEHGAGALLVVERAGQAGKKSREVMIPLAKAICREIDVKARSIRVDPPEGLLDLADG
jgi:16S rRNA processing protein RimM